MKINTQTLRNMLLFFFFVLFGTLATAQAQDVSTVVVPNGVVISTDTTSVPTTLLYIIVVGALGIFALLVFLLGRSAPVGSFLSSLTTLLGTTLVKAGDGLVASTDSAVDDEAWATLKKLFRLETLPDGTMKLTKIDSGATANQTVPIRELEKEIYPKTDPLAEVN